MVQPTPKSYDDDMRLADILIFSLADTVNGQIEELEIIPSLNDTECSLD